MLIFKCKDINKRVHANVDELKVLKKDYVKSKFDKILQPAELKRMQGYCKE